MCWSEAHREEPSCEEPARGRGGLRGDRGHLMGFQKRRPSDSISVNTLCSLMVYITITFCIRVIPFAFKLSVAEQNAGTKHDIN